MHSSCFSLFPNIQSLPQRHFKLTLCFICLIALLALTGCSYTYLPPVPASAISERPTRLVLSSASQLSFDNQRLEMQLIVLQLPQEGWLELQFFDPFGTEIGSASKYLKQDDIGKVRYLYPASKVQENGTYRAIASFKGVIVRQFSTEVMRDGTN